MARTGRPKAELVLTDDERAISWCGGRGGRSRRRRWRCARGSCWRARTGWPTRRSPADLGCAPATVGKWRAPVRGAAAGRAGRRAAAGSAAVDHRGAGRGRGGRDVGVDAARTRRTGRGRRWPSGPGCRKSTIGRIWRAFGLKPHRADTFKLSTDPLFVEKVYDVVGLYLNPPERAVVLCVDEKSPGPGAGPVPAGVPDDAGHARAAHPRLRPARHHQPVRRVQHRRRHRDRASCTAGTAPSSSRSS